MDRQFAGMRVHKIVGVCCLALWLLAGHATPVAAQVSAAISGTVTDASGAAVSGASVDAKNIGTSETRGTVTDEAGRYKLLALPVGQYELTVAKDGFSKVLRQGVSLVVGQEATVDFALKVGDVRQQVTVTAEAPVVNLTTTDISGVVGETQVKDLPLNGRSYDELLTLNPGIVNFTAEKTGGIGVSNSTVAGDFSVSGNRPQQNLFLLNGVEYTGAAENNMQPGGTSGQLLGVDAVREFNVLRNTYDAAYGKHPGGQVSIITQSGTNQWHGSAFEFLRDHDLDAPNYFDIGKAPSFLRNQFGGSLGGPVQKDKTFLFFNYEGFRQNLDQTSVAFVPDAGARNPTAPKVGTTPIVLGSGCGAMQAQCAALITQLLNLWPSSPDDVEQGSGIAEHFGVAPQVIREDFGTGRIDHKFNDRDSLTGVYTVDDSADTTATVADPFSTDVESLREQVVSIAETHVFSPFLLNTLTFGYSRASYYFLGEPTPGTAAINTPSFIAGHPVGAVTVGGSAASNAAATLGLAGSNNGTNLDVNRNLFTTQDQVSWTKGRHQFNFGVWFQPFQSNDTIGLSQFGQSTFSNLTSFLQGTITTFTYDPEPTAMNWRSLFGAWYAEDTIRATSHLTVTLGFRDEFSNGLNEANGRASTFVFVNGVVQTAPQIGKSVFTVNRAKFLPEPRIGLAWSPLGPKTVVRAGFGISNDLQDALSYRMDQNAPFNPTYSMTNSAGFALSALAFPINCTVNAHNCPGLILPAGVQPDMYTPTVESWSLTVQQELSPNTSFSIGYVGNHGYHEIVSVDANEPAPVVCPATPCPAAFPNTAAWGALAGKPVPAGTLFGTTNVKPNPALGPSWSWFSEGTSSYNALVLDITRRFGHGLTFRGAYTWSKTLDDGDSLNATTAANAPGLVADPANLHEDRGLATFDVRNVGTANASYELPFGKGQHWLGDRNDIVGQIVGGWAVNSIVTVQSGFPYTPQLSYNPSLNGDTKNPVRPFLNPNPGPAPAISGVQWFNPNDFIAQPNNSGFYGNVGRDTFIGPGLADWDFSAMKNTQLTEGIRLQLRAEFFNLLNRANFLTPNLIVGTPTGVSPTGGLITSTATTSRQIQLGLKLLW